jgi:hypothetical protein
MNKIQTASCTLGLCAATSLASTRRQPASTRHVPGHYTITRQESGPRNRVATVLTPWRPPLHAMGCQALPSPRPQARAIVDVPMTSAHTPAACGLATPRGSWRSCANVAPPDSGRGTGTPYLHAWEVSLWEDREEEGRWERALENEERREIMAGARKKAGMGDVRKWR